MIYLDNFATTPIDPLVQKAVVDCMHNTWGNPHSVTHVLGWQAGDVVDDCRRCIARALRAKPHEVVFTSGASEANNTAIKSIGGITKKYPYKHKILISAIEHPCVRESAYYMAQHGYTVVEMPVCRNGVVDMRAYGQMLDDTVGLVSVMLVNNELGTIQDIKTMAQLAHRVGAVFHTDAAQAVGKMPVAFHDIGVDFMSLSGHKIYGPKGVGALLVKQGTAVTPLLHGGGQERGMRAGTVATPLVKGLATAVDLAVQAADTHCNRIAHMRDMLERIICRSIPQAKILGGDATRIAAATNIYIPNVYAQDVFTHLQGVAVSTGSACASAGKGTSTTLQAIGIDAQTTAVALRMCVCRTHTQHDITTAAKAIVDSIHRSQQ